MTYRPEKPCPVCGDTTRSGISTVCRGCEPDVTRTGLISILNLLVDNLAPNTQLCPADGCLILTGEDCPACIVRRARTNATTARRPAPQGRRLPPPGWVRKGGILVRKKAA